MSRKPVPKSAEPYVVMARISPTGSAMLDARKAVNPVTYPSAQAAASAVVKTMSASLAEVSRRLGAGDRFDPYTNVSFDFDARTERGYGTIIVDGCLTDYSIFRNPEDAKGIKIEETKEKENDGTR